jgi:hypothetical protein
MKDTNSLHLKLQEYTDCFAEADPSRELRRIASRGIAGDKTQDMTELALKYLSLAILAGVNTGADKVFFTCRGDQNGSCFLAGEEETRLPTPPTGVTQEIIGILRRITGLEPDRAYGSLVCGIRNDRLVMDVGVARAGERETLSLTVLRQ